LTGPVAHAYRRMTRGIMDCHNHPAVSAAGACTGCAEPFCRQCMVVLMGQPYCGSCKAMAVPEAVAVQVPCKQASEALKYALVGIFCFGIVLEPVAIAKALEARKLIQADPTLSGSGKATAALVLGCSILALWVIAMYSKFAGR
jgi:hypothetical protein